MAGVVGKIKLVVICYAFVEKIFTDFEEEGSETEKQN